MFFLRFSLNQSNGSKPLIPVVSINLNEVPLYILCSVLNSFGLQGSGLKVFYLL